MKNKPIIIKVGTNTISNEHGQLHLKTIDAIAHQILELRKKGHMCVLITSGAIACGMQIMELTKRPEEPTKRQVCASAGQIRLIKTWQKAFGEVRVSQHLITRDLFNCPRKTKDFQKCLLLTLELGFIPIVNENDALSTEEIDQKFTDNDSLAAFLATNIQAKRLVILSQVDGLHRLKNGQIGELITEVAQINEEILSHADGKSSLGTGGMRSKLLAIKTCTDSGIPVYLTNGKTKDSILQTFGSNFVGTKFLPKSNEKNPSIGVIGAGNMGGSIFRGLQKCFHQDLLFLADKKKSKLTNFEINNKTTNLTELLNNTQFVLIAIKPQDFIEFCAENKNLLKDKIILSIMAGVSVEKIKDLTGSEKIVRAMPNLGASVNQSLTGWLTSWQLSLIEENLVDQVLSSFGKHIRLENEEQIDLITALSGSGIAYYFYLAEIFQTKAKDLGFDADQAETIARETFFAGAKLAKQNPNISFTQWQEMVSSKGGTTEAALNLLRDKNFPGQIEQALTKSIERAKELGT